ncbi:MAG: hypothetical protein HY816_11225 [Candidatus Wallbacteria bacterium]|nr:hypothetical protein [Candidatus Wallbacteria bacterium]
MDSRELGELKSVGKATLGDLRRLGVTTVNELARRDPKEMYDELCRLTGVRHDPCCEDVFACAVAQARDPELPEEQRDWWFWSRQRRTATR